MRLMCPNCEAQYEVSDSVIPLHGRDVQCSNCGQTWFQTHPQAEPEAAADEDDPDYGGDDSLPNVAAAAWDSEEPADPGLEPGSVPESEPESEPGSEPEPVAAAASPSGAEETGDPQAATSFPPDPDAPQPAFAATDTPDERPADAPEDLADARNGGGGTALPTSAEALAAGVVAGATAAAPETKRRSLDEAVLSVLREEAEREARARRAAGGIETQTDLNLPAAEPAVRVITGLDSLPKLRVQPQADSHVAGPSGTGPRRPVEDLSAPVGPEAVEPAATQRQSRRALLPDIEEFSSSLQAIGGKSAAAAAAAQIEPGPVRRGGFRTGFLLVILLAVLVFGLYASAPALGSRFPAAVPKLNQFVATVDKGRVMLDQLMQSSLDQLKGGEKPTE